jgi:hypothetical protein
MKKLPLGGAVVKTQTRPSPDRDEGRGSRPRALSLEHWPAAWPNGRNAVTVCRTCGSNGQDGGWVMAHGCTWVEVRTALGVCADDARERWRELQQQG